MKKELSFQETLDLALEEYGEGEGFDAQQIPSRLLSDFAIKLFEKTGFDGDKGEQDRVLDAILPVFTVLDQYKLGIIDNTFLVDYYRDNEDIEDLAILREQNNR